jgi:hypothetical protein
MRDSTETIRVELGAGDNGWSGHGFDERTAFGFVSKDGDERRGIDDHSARQPVLVVPEDLVRRSGIEDGELGAAARDVRSSARRRFGRCRRTRASRSRSALMIASVLLSPVRLASSLARRSASSFLIFSAMCVAVRKSGYTVASA